MKDLTNISVAKISIRTIDGTVFTAPDEIIFIEASQGCCLFYFSGQQMPLRTYVSISAIRENMPAYFFSCHRSFIINLHHVKKVAKDNRTVLLTDDHTVKMSENCINGFYERFCYNFRRK